MVQLLCQTRKRCNTLLWELHLETEYLIRMGVTNGQIDLRKDKLVRKNIDGKFVQLRTGYTNAHGHELPASV